MKNLHLFGILLCLLLLSSCTKEPKEQIIGKWKRINGREIVHFTSEGTLLIQIDNFDAPEKQLLSAKYNFISKDEVFVKAASGLENELLKIWVNKTNLVTKETKKEITTKFVRIDDADAENVSTLLRLEKKIYYSWADLYDYGFFSLRYFLNTQYYNCNYTGYSTGYDPEYSGFPDGGLSEFYEGGYGSVVSRSVSKKVKIFSDSEYFNKFMRSYQDTKSQADNFFSKLTNPQKIKFTKLWNQYVQVIQEIKSNIDSYNKKVDEYNQAIKNISNSEYYGFQPRPKIQIAIEDDLLKRGMKNNN